MREQQNPQDRCTEEGRTPAQNIAVQVRVPNVCLQYCVMDKQGKELAEAVAGKFFCLWQAAGACALFNIPSNSCYVMQIRHHPDPNPAPTSSQGGFQRSV